MNNTEIKSEKNDSSTAAQLDRWQPGGGTAQLVAVAEPAVDWSLRSFRNEAEVRAINCALRQTGGNRKRAAKLLSISYRSLLYKIRQHDIIPSAQHG
jgi:transcriptional regulator with PAS, ATPase and Fis domain